MFSFSYYFYLFVHFDFSLKKDNSSIFSRITTSTPLHFTSFNTFFMGVMGSVLCLLFSKTPFFVGNGHVISIWRRFQICWPPQFLFFFVLLLFFSTLFACCHFVNVFRFCLMDFRYYFWFQLSYFSGEYLLISVLNNRLVKFLNLICGYLRISFLDSSL